MHKNRTFKSVCAIAVSALLVMQNLSPAVSVLADEIKDNDETNGTTIVSVAEPTVVPAESEEVVVVPADETEETVDENVDSVPADDAEPTEVSEDVDTNPPIEQTDVTEPSDETEVTEVTEATEETTVDETEPTEATEATEETTVETEEPVEEVTEDLTIVDEPAEITIAQSAEEYADLVAGLSDYERVIVNTTDDLNGLVIAGGVYYDGTYIIGFANDADLNSAIGYFAAMGYEYALDGDMDLCGVGDGVILYGETNPSATVKVAVIDSGSNNANEYYSVIGDDTADYNGHGTDMCNYILNETDDAYIISIKAFGDSKASVADVTAAIELAESLDVDYILLAMSIRDNGQYEAFESLIAGTNATVVASAGNNARDAQNYLPARANGVIAVGANDAETAYLAPFSNYGECVSYYVLGAESTSEAAATALGILIAGYNPEESSVLMTSTIKVADYAVAYSKGSSEVFELDEVRLSANGATIEAFTSADIAGAGCSNAAEWNAKVANQAQSNLGIDYPAGCVGYACDTVRDAGISTSYGSGKTWEWVDLGVNGGVTSFMNGAGCSDPEDWGIIGIRRPSYTNGSYESIAVTDFNALYDYVVANAEPGDVLVFGNYSDTTTSYHWKHMAIYMGTGGTTWRNEKGCLIIYESNGTTPPPGNNSQRISHSRIFNAEDLVNWSNSSGSADTSTSSGSKNWETVVILKAADTPPDLPLGLAKVNTASAYNTMTQGNSCYDFAGTRYTLYADSACTQALFTYTFGSDGHTTGDIYKLPGSEVANEPTYFLKETAAGPGYKIDNTVYSVSFHADRTVTVSGGSNATVTISQSADADHPAEITLADEPMTDPFGLTVRKENKVNTTTTFRMDAVTFHIQYYAGDYAVNTSLAGVNPTDDFYVTITNTSANDYISKYLMLQQLAGQDPSVTVTGDNDYLAGVYNSGVTNREPLGTYIIQESTAPTGYEVNPTVMRVRMYDTGNNTAQTQIVNTTTNTELSGRITITNGVSDFVWEMAETHSIGYYSLVKTISDTREQNNPAGFDYSMYWIDNGTYKLFATGVSQSDGRVYWTYQLPNYGHLEDDGVTITPLTGTKTYTLEILTGETYEVRETAVYYSYGNQNSGLQYIPYTPQSWTLHMNTSGTIDYFYKTVTVTANQDASDTDDNNWEESAGFSVYKTKPTGDLFDFSKVTFTAYTYVNGTRYDIATGTVDTNGNITWTRTDTSGYGIYQAGNYDNRTSVNALVSLPCGTYYVEEAWDKMYVDTLDASTQAAVEVFATNNTSGWTTNDAGTKYISTITVDCTTPNTTTVVALNNPQNDWHYQWFSANKTVTVAGDASTIEFELYYNNGTDLVLFATGYANTNGIGTYPIIWDGYQGPAEFVQNNGQKIVLPEGDYEIREIVPETYYQNGADNVPYTYMVPTGWQDHLGANGHSDYFYKTFSAANNAETTISSVNPVDTRIEAELTIRKVEQSNSPSQTFTFAIYYRGNEDQPLNLGDFSDAYLLDTVTVTTTQGTGLTTLTKIPEGWYEVVEINNNGWECVWMNDSTNTANGKLVHASSENKTVSQIVIQDNLVMFGTPLSGIWATNIIRPDVTPEKHDAWTYDLLATPIEHPANVHLTFYLYADQNQNGVLDQAEIDFGYMARIDGDDDGEVTFKSIAAGYYIVREVATVNGYYLTAADAPVIASDPVNYVVPMSNKPYTETVKVTKVDNETDELLSGAEFTVYLDSNDNGKFDAADQVAQMWNDANGNDIVDAGELSNAVLVETSTGIYESYELHFNDGFVDADGDGILDANHFGNRYFIVETKAPDNYFFVNADGTFSNTSRVETFTVDKKDTTAADFQVGSNEYTFRNQTGTVFAKKTNQNGEFLSGAEFTVYSDAACTQAVGVLTEDTANETYSYKGLGLGTYYLKETKAPTDFEIDPNAYEFEVTLNQVHPVVVNFMSYKYNIDGAFVDVEIHTTANDPLIATPESSYSIIARESTATTIVDLVYFDGLIIGTNYSVTGDLVYQKAFDGHAAGEVITSKTVTFVAGDTNDASQHFTVNADGTTIEGYIEVEFSVDTTKIFTTIVAFERVENLDTGMVVGTHASLTDTPQTKVVPHIGTTITDQQTMINQASLGGIVTLNDAVAFENLVKGETYTIDGILYDVDTQAEYKDANGKTVTNSVTFVADGTVTDTFVLNGQVIELVSGTVDVTFKLDVTDLEGRSFVAYEYLSMVGDNGPVQISSHEDINDEGQTIHVPKIRTHANVPDETIRLAPAVEEYIFTDTVSFENLIVGKEYTASGILMNAETGEILLDEDGNPYTGETVFTPTTPNGTVDVQFTVNTLWLQGTTVVVFEDLFYNGIKIATHADLKDTEQSFDIPELHTTATTAIGNVVEYSTQAVVTDRVFFSNLIVGKEYTVTGNLAIKGTENFVLDAQGNKVTATQTFTAEASEGYVDVVFTFDATLYQGETLVAFETLTYNGIEYATHANIDDEEQTVYVPKIGTTATDANGNKTFQVTEQATVIDEIAFENLEVGRTYLAEGILMDKTTGAPLLVNGEQVTASTTFVPETANGKATVTFTFNASALAGKSVVVFEKVYDISGTTSIDKDTGLVVTDETAKILIATHEDINDENQTVNIIETKTGDNSGFGTFATCAAIAAGVAGIAGLAYVALGRKKKNQQGEA